MEEYKSKAKESYILELLENYVKQGSEIIFEIYEVVDILSGNYMVYKLECRDIKIVGNTDTCTVRVFKKNKELFTRNFLKKHKDYGTAIQETISYFENIINKLERNLKEEKKILDITENKRNVVINPDTLLVKQFVIKALDKK